MSTSPAHELHPVGFLQAMMLLCLAAFALALYVAVQGLLDKVVLAPLLAIVFAGLPLGLFLWFRGELAYTRKMLAGMTAQSSHPRRLS